MKSQLSNVAITNLATRLELARSMAVEAGDRIREVAAGGDLGTTSKGDRDVVTRADVLAERSIVQALQARFPEDGIVAEEGSHRAGSSGIVWFLDPLDGTLNFSRGIPVWCVSIAAFSNGRPVLGVVHDPLRGETFCAAKKMGAWLNGEPISCNRGAETAACVVHLTIDFQDNSMVLGLRDISHVAPRVLRTRNIGAVALALAYCAAGRVDAVVHRLANPWDCGAGVILTQEAGGVVTGLDGREYDETHRSLLAAANPTVHGDLLALISQEA